MARASASRARWSAAPTRGAFAGELLALAPEAPALPPEEAGSQETRLYTRDAIDTRREFREAIIGQELRGEGVDVTVGADGTVSAAIPPLKGLLEIMETGTTAEGLTLDDAAFRAMGFAYVAETCHPGYTRPTSLTFRRDL